MSPAQHQQQIKHASVWVKQAWRAWKAGKLTGNPAVRPPETAARMRLLRERVTPEIREEFEDDFKSLIQNPLENAMDILHGLPVRTNPHVQHPLFFALIRGAWEPAYNAELNPDTGYAVLGLRSEAGTETWPAPMGEWAHVDAAGNPSVFPEYFETDAHEVSRGQTNNDRSVGSSGT